MSCNVCLDDFTDGLRKKTECPYCNSASCLKCAKQCALLWASNPKCPNCKKTFTDSILESMFTKNFRRGDLRKQAIINLQEQEMSLLPASLEVLQAQKAREKYYLKSSQLKHELSQIEVLLYTVPETQLDFTNILQIQKDFLEIGYTETKKRSRDILRRSVKCPGADCRGFIYKSGIGANTCTLCNHKLCSHCNSSISDDHLCSESDIASWKLIRDSTVPCPKCATNIEKISGCNQMWCTMKDCNTAFDWVSGKVINGPVHNPHYHQWLSQGGIVVENPNLLCAAVDIFSAQRFSLIYGILDQPCQDQSLIQPYSLCKQFLRVLPELGYMNYRNDVEYGPMTHESLRLEYLEGKISKEHWRSKLSHRETLRIKYMRISALQEMLRSASSDIFLQLFTDIRKISLDDVGLPSRNGRNINPKRIIPILDTFNNSLEMLRLYHIKEICRVLSDYSDTHAIVLDYHGNENPYLMWAKKSVQNLNEKYNTINPF